MSAVIGRKPKVALTRGHDPSTPGKRSFDGKLREWAFNDDMAARLNKHLLFNGIDVLLTIPTGGADALPDINTHNGYLNRKARIAKINAWKPDLEIEFHANACGTNWNSGRGQILYIAASKRGTDSEKFINVLRKYMRSVAGTGSITPDRGFGYKNFDIVNGVKAPCCLIEHAFMTNHEDVALLLSDVQRDKWAEAEARAVCEWFAIPFKNYKNVVTPPKPPKPPVPKMPTLKRGMVNNDDVRKLQNAINKFIADKKNWLDVDGDFGELTEQALIAVQKALLPSSPLGVADQATWDKLLA